MQALTFHTDDFFSSIDYVISNLIKDYVRKKRKNERNKKHRKKVM